MKSEYEKEMNENFKLLNEANQTCALLVIRSLKYSQDATRMEQIHPQQTA